MALYAKTPRFALPEYLTALTEYLVIDEPDEGAFTIRDDTGLELYCCWDDCSHLSGGDWQRIETED